ncbi:MAG: hypothetical protein PHD81_04190 [Candidatus Nanoarchaeia archaeon]|nr:hypothetical protein [Candidatus Nanoarchaeia archaeon]MDD5588282.1 hypothetical protein [Candidatus Nanoarchaeia archaeon]
MKNKYNLIGKKYLAPVLVAGSILCGANSYAQNALPIKQETKEAILESQKVEAQVEAQKQLEKKLKHESYCKENTERTINDFNESIKDKKFDVKEQRKVYNDLEGLTKNNCPYSEDIKNLQEFTSIRGYFKGPKLQKEFKDMGLNITVENDQEVYALQYLAYLSGVCLITGIVRVLYDSRKPKKKQIKNFYLGK